MTRGKCWLLGAVGTFVMLFGLSCLNYTKLGGVEHHTQVAREHGWPPPSVGIAHCGMFLAPLGAGVVGFVIGRRNPRAQNVAT
jgi:hypothetical protein